MIYKTTDIYISTTLLTKGATLKEVEIDEGIRRQAVFVLNTENMDVEAMISLYKQRKLSIDAYTFVDTFKGLKQHMYDKLNTR